jgi:hypothetical protein
MARVQASDFMRALRVEFPGLVDELDDDVWRGLLHLETACFARFVQAVIDDGNRAEVARCFEWRDDGGSATMMTSRMRSQSVASSI